MRWVGRIARGAANSASILVCVPRMESAAVIIWRWPWMRSTTGSCCGKPERG